MIGCCTEEIIVPATGRALLITGVPEACTFGMYVDVVLVVVPDGM